MSAPRSLTIVGMGSDDRPNDARGAAALEEADAVFGPGEGAGSEDGRRRSWRSPFSSSVEEIARSRERGSVAVEATGDPMHFGVGGTLARQMDAWDGVEVLPAPSAFSLAAARMGWPIEDVGCLSLHGTARSGRGVNALCQWVAPHRRLLVLARDRKTPGEVAQWLRDHGWSNARLAVLERMDSSKEKQTEWTSSEEIDDRFDDVLTLAVDCGPSTGSKWFPLSPGLPDECFETDGKMTKRELRAFVVPNLRPSPGATLWDVGAGSGSVGIEWARLSPGGVVHAVEPNAKRRGMIERNSAKFGLANVRPVEGRAPEALSALATPDAIFIGGGLTTDDLAKACIESVAASGVIVANAVTLEGEARLAALQSSHGGSLTRIAVAHADEIGAFRGWRPAMPVTVWTWEKPS